MSFVARAPTEAHLPSLSLFSSSSSTATFTSQLRETLVQSRSIIDTWVVNEKKRVDQHVKEAKQQLVSKQQTIDATSAQLLALQLQHGCRIADDDTKQYLSTEARGSNSNTLSKQQTELESMIEQQTKKNQRLDAQLAELKKEIRDLQIEEDTCKTRATMAQQRAAMAIASKDTTENDLTRGILNYKYLGIEFQKAEHDRVKFTFTQLDRANPDQEYSFCLGSSSDTDDTWSIFDCTPIQLKEETLQVSIEPLNRTNDMLSFVRSIRRAFVEHINNST